MTHFFNEYFDYPTDCQHENPSPWTGGSKVLPRGLLQRRVALRAGWILAAFSGLFLTLPTMTLLSTASVGGVAAARTYGGIAALAVVPILRFPPAVERRPVCVESIGGP